MKTKLLVATAFAFALTPVAFSDDGVEESARSYTIDVTGDVLPASLGDLGYPYRAAEDGLAGVCEVELVVGETGMAQNYTVASCSDDAFQGAATSFAETLSFDENASDSVQSLTVAWNIES